MPMAIFQSQRTLLCKVDGFFTVPDHVHVVIRFVRAVDVLPGGTHSRSECFAGSVALSCVPTRALLI